MNNLRITATATLQGTTPRRVLLRAYTGSVMRLYGWSTPVVVDLAGMKFNKSVPLLSDHLNTISGTVGAGTPKREAGELNIDGFLADNSTADEIHRLLKAKVPLQASIGAETIRRQHIKPGETLVANGRQYTAGPEGLNYISESYLREVSIVVLGGDPQTSVIAARAAGGYMNFEAWVLAMGFDPATLSESQRINMQRQFELATAEPAPTPAPAPTPVPAPAPAPIAAGVDPAVVRLLSNNEALLVRAANECWDINRARAEALESLRASRTAPATMQAGQRVASEPADIITAALMVRAGFAKGAEQAYGPQVMEQSRHLHEASLVDMYAAGLRLSGQQVPVSRREMIKAAMSGGTVTTALDNTANKIVELVWKTSRPTWRSFCRIRSAKNFKQHTALRPTFANNLEQMPKSGVFPHGSIGEETYNYKVHNYGKMYSISYEDVVNDDLDIFSEVLPGFANAAQRSMADLVYATLLSNANDFFHVDHGNLATGAGSALGSTALKTAIKKMRVQRDPSNNTIDMTPSVLVVPPTLEYEALNLINSTEIFIISATDGVYPTGNPLNRLTKVDVEPRLENGVTDPSTGTSYSGSSTQWFLFASPAELPMVFAFLNGQETPVIESFGLDRDPNRLAYSYRVHHAFGCAFGDYRAAVKNTGI